MAALFSALRVLLTGLARVTGPYRAALQAEPRPVLLLDRRLRIRDLNPPARELPGMQVRSVLGRRLDRHLPAPAGAGLVELVGAARAGSGTTVRTLRDWPATGRANSVCATVLPRGWLRLELPGSPTVSAGRYHAFFEHHPDPVFTVDAAGRVELVSRYAETVTGYRNEDLHHPHFSVLVDPADRERVARFVSDAMGGRAGTIEAVLRTKQGGRRHAQITAVPLLGPVGIEGVIGISKDITERVEMEQRLAASEALHRVIVEASTDGIALRDEAGRVTFTNPALRRILGRAEEEILGHTVLDPAVPEERHRLAAQLRALRAGRSWRGEVRARRPDGSEAWLLVSAVPLPRSDGRYEGSLSIVTDITARKAMEAALEASREELRRLSDFLQASREEDQRRISRELHDEFGQLLSVLRIDVEWLRNRDAAAPYQQKLERMQEILDRGLASLRQLIVALRPPVLDDVGLAAACEWLLEDLRRRTHLQINFEHDRDEYRLAEPVATAVFRVLQEALTNVIKHSQAERVVVMLRQGDAKLQLAIADDGVGISAEALSKPQAFGLLGMRERMEALGGSLAIASGLYGGTVLEAEVPLDADTRGNT